MGDKCYILGAGASYGHDTSLPREQWPPQTHQFFQKCSGLLRNDDFSTLRRGIEEYIETAPPDAPDSIFGWEQDIEAILDWLTAQFDEACTPPKDFDRMRWTQTALSECFYFLYESLRRYSIDYTPGADAYTALASHYEQNQYEVITLNYDTLFESALEYVGTDYHYRLTDWQLGSVPIAKLHGSINWLNYAAVYQSGATDFSGIVYPVYSNRFSLREVTEMSPSDLSDRPYGALASSQEELEEPALVPPVADKRRVDKVDVYHRVWRYAEQILQSASELVIIGCSFRPGDEQFRNLVRNYTRDNVEVTIASPSAGEVRTLVEPLLTSPSFRDPYPNFEAYVDTL